MKYSTLAELNLNRLSTEDNLIKIQNKINTNLEKGFISEELHEKATFHILNLIEKGENQTKIGEIKGWNNKQYQKTDTSWIENKN